MDGQAGLRLCCWQTSEDRFSRLGAHLSCDKTNNVTMCHKKSINSVWSETAVHMKKAWVLGNPPSPQCSLIRLGGSPGWSESLLCFTHFVGFVMSCHGSFTHVIAQLFYFESFCFNIPSALTVYTYTVMPTKSDSDVIFCLQLLSRTLTCSLHLRYHELIDHLCINPILWTGLIHKWSIDYKPWFLCKQNMMSLSLLVGRTIYLL